VSGIKVEFPDLQKTVDRIKDNNTLATMRALNVLNRQGKKDLIRNVQKDTGHKQSTIKRSIRDKKARFNDLTVRWFTRGSRLQYPGVKPIRRGGRQVGISYLAKGKNRVRKLEPVQSGSSKPFTIKARHSGKEIAVFIANDNIRGYRRKVTTYQGHSMPFLMDKSWEKKTQKFISKRFAPEYAKQLKKVQFRGKR
jgi:hypothetical protein